ncbi:HPr family phosphocarrier protein [Salipaludibacillus sp. LMS25]|jgi:phosphotransferase system HPr-like phosphotransfer protein|uniref:HPr family phosphocarrier protein n=1 Tax=Salipaludibacillus sp. LMS25 TaxID=2924031 RepID=UPI0020D14950|nr:HPr family phosphocarrier protein [Salipaludibacillus sp. LMS25]UTR14766.1 HPr family phosphocarrier protein [Salipaludibacillus sp. LMS25]
MELSKDIQLKEPFNMSKVLKLVQLCSTFNSDIYIQKNMTAYNCKCVLGTANIIISMKENEHFSISVHGSDAKEALDQVGAFFEKTGAESPVNV